VIFLVDEFQLGVILFSYCSLRFVFLFPLDPTNEKKRKYGAKTFGVYLWWSHCRWACIFFISSNNKNIIFLLIFLSFCVFILIVVVYHCCGTNIFLFFMSKFDSFVSKNRNIWQFLCVTEQNWTSI